MSRILVAEDNPLDAHRVRWLLEASGFEVQPADDGKAALEVLRAGKTDLVLTDLQMPELDGLQLVEAVRQDYPWIPIILMTQNGSEEIAVAALQKGAASYVPKRHLQRDIVATIDDVLASASSQRHTESVLRFLERTEFQFVLGNDADLTTPLIGYLQQSLSRQRFCDELTLIRVGVALREALINAIHHGNLEVSSALREGDDKAYFDLVAQRARQSPYCERRLRVVARERPGEVTYVIRDEGPGFDPARVPDPTDPGNVGRVTGRGLFLIRTFMDEVRHNAAGNEITLVKRCAGPAATSAAGC
jgi:CheY-like chemotaxis protein/anti-sigma regulatory factor (Ser/Thr protein kinase)